MQIELFRAFTGPDGNFRMVIFLRLLLALGLLWCVVLPLWVGALIHQMSAGYLGQPIGVREAYRRAAPRLGRLVLAYLLTGLLLFGAAVLSLAGVRNAAQNTRSGGTLPRGHRVATSPPSHPDRSSASSDTR